MALQTAPLRLGMLGDENPFQFDVNWTVSKLFKMALGAVLNKEVKKPQECLLYNLEMTYRSDTGDGTRGDNGWVINREYLDYNKDGRKKVKTIVPYHDLVCLTRMRRSPVAMLKQLMLQHQQGRSLQEVMRQRLSSISHSLRQI
eukprot:s2624_g10.t1